MKQLTVSSAKLSTGHEAGMMYLGKEQINRLFFNTPVEANGGA